MLNSTLRLEGTTPVAILEGRLDGTGGTRLQELSKEFAAGTRFAILGMDKVDFISSAGIRVLLILERNLRKAGGGLVLAGLSPFVSRTLATGGLRELRTAISVEAALARLPELTDAAAATHTVAKRQYAHRRIEGEPAQLVVFVPKITPGGGAPDLTPVALTDLGYCIGTGGFGNMREQAQEALGAFISIGNTAGVLPRGEGEVADFVVTGDGVPPVMYVQQGLGFSGAPAAVVDLIEGPAISVEGLLADVMTLPGDLQPPIGFVILAWTDGSLSPAGAEKATGLIVMGVSGDAAPGQSGSHRRLQCQGLLVDRLELNPTATHPDGDLAPLRNINRLRHVLPIDPAAPLEVRRVWVFAPRACRTALARPPVPSANHPVLNRAATQPAFSFLQPAAGSGELGRMGPYRVVKLLGKGGMGLVFEAIDLELQQRVALKVMKPELCQDAEFRQRFIREARATAAIKSKYIVKIHHVAEQNDIPFLAMEFLEGQPLHEWQRTRRPAFSEILHVSKEIAKGLAAAHAEGLLHRDIKPDNIWVEHSGGVKLLDFGLTCPVKSGDRLTQAGKVVGTPEYMAPEQARGLKNDERSDLFSLGCVLYELVGNQQPFRGENIIAILTAVATSEPEPLEKLTPSIPSAYRALVNALLKKSPANRPSSANEVLQILETITTAGVNETAPAAPPTAPPRPRYGLVAAAILALLVFLAGLYFR